MLSAKLAVPVLLLLQLAVPAAAQVAPPPATTPPGSPPAAAAQETAEGLIGVLRLDEILDLMREEGLDYGQSLQDDLFPDTGDRAWRREVERIYASPRMRQSFFPRIRAEFATLTAGEREDAESFYRSELGLRIVEMENSARRLLLDKEVVEANVAAAEELRLDNPGRAELLDRFIALNDLVEGNVVLALNSNAAFYFGLNETFPEPLNESEVLSDVWSQEDDVREGMQEWVFSYLALAYRDLSDEEQEAYLAFTGTQAGRALNRALFAAYDAMFLDISRDLGRAAAGFISGQEI